MILDFDKARYDAGGRRVLDSYPVHLFEEAVERQAQAAVRVAQLALLEEADAILGAEPDIDDSVIWDWLARKRQELAL